MIINTENKTQYPELRDLGFNSRLVPIQTTPYPFTAIDPEVGVAVLRDRVATGDEPDDNRLEHEVIGIVGNRYQIVHNSDLYESLIEASQRAFISDHGVQLTEESARNGAWSKATLHYPSIGLDIRQLTGKSTHLRLKAGFTNTYDGSGKVRVQVGCTDLWCMNGSSVLESSRMVGKHTSGFDLKSLTNFLVQGFETFHQKVSIWQQWADRRVTPTEAKKLLKDLGLDGRRAEGIMTQIEKEFDQRGESLWSVYSALTYEASHSSEAFPARKTKGASTTALTLDRRASNVERLVNSPAFLAMAA
tara:strand:+ start:1073 stop:1984 length:912 start_codon:yes stop_codon:yes gene_type:complete